MLRSSDRPEIRAGLECVGDPEGVTILAIPRADREPFPGETLAAIEARTSSWVVLEITRVDGNRFEIRDRKNTPPVISWRVEHAMTTPANPAGGDDRTVHEPRRFHTFGSRALLVPESRLGNDSARAGFRSFADAGRFRHAILLAGDRSDSPPDCVTG